MGHQPFIRGPPYGVLCWNRISRTPVIRVIAMQDPLHKAVSILFVVSTEPDIGNQIRD